MPYIVEEVEFDSRDWITCEHEGCGINYYIENPKANLENEGDWIESDNSEIFEGINFGPFVVCYGCRKPANDDEVLNWAKQNLEVERQCGLAKCKCCLHRFCLKPIQGFDGVDVLKILQKDGYGEHLEEIIELSENKEDLEKVLIELYGPDEMMCEDCNSDFLESEFSDDEDGFEEFKQSLIE